MPEFIRDKGHWLHETSDSFNKIDVMNWLSVKAKLILVKLVIKFAMKKRFEMMYRENHKTETFLLFSMQEPRMYW